MELISVIIPVYNTQKYLSKCIESFTKQTYRMIEIILVDDGSTDESPAICDRYAQSDTRIKVIHKSNGGASEARNIGIAKAEGELITFFDSDDYADKDYIEYLYEIKRKQNVQMSVCAYNVADEDENVLFTMEYGKDLLIDKRRFYELMLNEKGITVSLCFKLYDKKLFNNVKLPLFKLYEDNGTTYKIIENIDGNIAYGNIAKAYYVIRKNSAMRSPFTIKKMDMIELTDQMCDYLEKHYDGLNDFILRRRIYARFNVLRQMDFSNNDTKELMDSIIQYIYDNKKFILCNRIVPVRDKVACLILCINKKLFFLSWEIYRSIKYGK